MNTRTHIPRKLLAKWISPISYPVIVNSFGRCGSTLLTEAIVEGLAKSVPNWSRRLYRGGVKQSAWDLNSKSIENGLVHKTHDIPPRAIPNPRIRVVYIFGSPYDTVASLLRMQQLKGSAWIAEHCRNLGCAPSNFGNILDSDALNMQRHFNLWRNDRRFKLCFVRYERLWDYRKELGEFLGIEPILPEFKKRRSPDLLDKSTKERISETYHSFETDVSKSPDFWLAN